jgi:lambda repressor-like predicted transcriptional regulator
MDVRDRIAAIEIKLRERGISVAKLCRRADLHPVTWVRWKNGCSVQEQNWQRVEAALAALAPDALDAAKAAA